jgi:hypothetical protein
MITLTHAESSTGAALSLFAQPLATPFAFAGGTFPGTSGTCSGSLALGSSCLVQLRFSPTLNVTSTTTFTLSYLTGVASSALVTTLSGTGVYAAPTLSSVTPITGTYAGGTVVTLTGSGFRSSATVTLGTSSCATVSVVSNSQILCTTQNTTSATDVTLSAIVTNLDAQAVTLTQAFAYRKTEFGNGSEGSVTLTSTITDVAANSTVLGRTFSASRKVSSIDTTSATTVTLHSSFTTSDFNSGDEILWMVMAGSSDTACGGGLYRGNYGFSRVNAVNIGAKTLTLDTAISGSPATLDNTKIGSVSTSSNFCRLQVVRVPNFRNLTLDSSSTMVVVTAPEWNYFTGMGGILALRVSETLTITGGNGHSFYAVGKGFTGGTSGTSTPNKGDGLSAGNIAGSGIDQTNNGSGGGARGSISSAGGAHIGAGGNGGSAGGLGGTAVSCGGGTCLFMGSGGGGGGGNAGTYGGGIIHLSAKTISASTLNLDAYASGANGSAGYGAGAGAGGSVVFKTQAASASMNLNAYGGAGANGGTGYSGGGGGGGKVIADFCSGTSPTASVIGGSAGTVSTGFQGTAGGAGSSSITSSASHGFCEL